MTDYNDGNWHGWNGGECPVHSESVVEVMIYPSGKATAKANYWDWAHYKIPAGDIVKFRVIHPYVDPPKPAEKWLVGNHAFDKKEAAERFVLELIAEHGDKFAAPEWKPRLFREVQE